MKTGGLLRLMPRGSEFGFLCLLGAKQPRAASSLKHASGQCVHFPVPSTRESVFPFCALLVASERLYKSDTHHRSSLVVCVLPAVAEKSEGSFSTPPTFHSFVYRLCGIITRLKLTNESLISFSVVADLRDVPGLCVQQLRKRLTPVGLQDSTLRRSRDSLCDSVTF